jgi:high affinity Mn2+ porin
MRRAQRMLGTRGLLEVAPRVGQERGPVPFLVRVGVGVGRPVRALGLLGGAGALLGVLMLGVVTAAHAESPSEEPGIRALPAPGRPEAATTGPPEVPPLKVPAWLGEILGETSEPEAVRLPGWFPRFLGAQATAIDQWILPFHSPYRDANSLKANGDDQITDTYGVYLGSRLTTRLQLYLDVEMFKGAAIGNATGLGGLTNGDVVRQGAVNLSTDPYIARAYLRYVIPLSSATEPVDRAMDHLPGREPERRVEVKFGRLASVDDFDQNRYANNTRTQFMNWSLWDNSAWDYPADTRGYDQGIMVGWITPTWAFRGGSYQMPTFANGNTLDEHVWNARGDVVELTLQPRPDWGTVVRVLGYVNQARMGIYRNAIAKAKRTGQTPDIRQDDHPGRIKWGGGLNIEQPLADAGETGVFLRLGYNDGQTESFAFTEVDRLATVGVQLSGVRWGRPTDRLGIAYVLEGLSPEHRHYLEQGGAGFVLGDGRLTYGLERILEVYYNWELLRYVHVSPDYQYIENPGYNLDRGPAHVFGLRVRVSF